MTDTKEQAEARMRMALAELGYENGYLVPIWNDGEQAWDFRWLGGDDIPPPVMYMAARLTMGIRIPCWRCWWFNGGFRAHNACICGDCWHPEGPALPPRELLRPPETKGMSYADTKDS
jgi:hypothetical protein